VTSLATEGECLGDLGKTRDSLQSYARALALAEVQLRIDPHDRWTQTSVALSGYSLGAGLVAAGDLRAGVAQLRKAAGNAEALLGADPDNAFMRNELALTLTELGGALGALGPSAAAEGCRSLERAVEIWEALRRSGRLNGENDQGRKRAAAKLAAPPCGKVRTRAQPRP
jgi:tetratricopeptide (TPR) repeat protein